MPRPDMKIFLKNNQKLGSIFDIYQSYYNYK